MLHLKKRWITVFMLSDGEASNVQGCKKKAISCWFCILFWNNFLHQKHIKGWLGENTEATTLPDTLLKVKFRF